MNTQWNACTGGRHLRYLTQLVTLLFCAGVWIQSDAMGQLVRYRVVLASPGGKLPFILEVQFDDGQPRLARVVNGEESIPLSLEPIGGGRLRMQLPYYGSEIEGEFSPDGQRITGVWSKISGGGKVTRMEFSGISAAPVDLPSPDPKRFLGRWLVQFSATSDPAVAVIERTDGNHVAGTFLTTTGDFRYLTGTVGDDDVLRLSTFDGAHAFLFQLRLSESDLLTGDFWSGQSWHETLEGARNDRAALSDGFDRVRATIKPEWGKIRFPDLSGKLRALDDPEFVGPLRIIQVFGSWCPNCHDAAVLMAELHKKYAQRGLRIIGLAFELNGDFAADRPAVEMYIKRHQTPYPVLIAGTADKSEAAATLGFLDQVQSFPTSIFVDRTGKIIAIYSGFSGPATGEEHRKLVEQFERIIERELDVGR